MDRYRKDKSPNFNKRTKWFYKGNNNYVLLKAVRTPVKGEFYEDVIIGWETVAIFKCKDNYV